MTDLYLLEAKYEIYLAEQKLLNNIASYETAKLVTEDTNQLQALDESVKDSIKEYLNKIVDAIQKAWDSFKSTVDEATIEAVINKNNEKALSNNNHQMYEAEDFEMPLYQVWNNTMSKIKIVELNKGNYATMSQNLDTVQHFIQNNYKDLYDEKDNVKQVMNNKTFAPAKGKIGLNNGVNDAINFLKNYSDIVNEISDDIKSLNNIKNQIDGLVDNLPGESTPTESAITLEDTLRMYFEADDKDPSTPDNSPAQADNNSNKESSNKATSADENPNDGNNDQPKSNATQDKKNIVNYFSAVTSVLSAKLSTCSKIKSRSLKLCKDFITTQGAKVNGVNLKAKAVENKPEDKQIKV